MATYISQRIITALPPLNSIKIFAVYSIGSFTYRFQKQGVFISTLLPPLSSGIVANCWIKVGGDWKTANFNVI